MSGNDKTKEYFDKEHSDFDAAYDLDARDHGDKKIKDIIRKISYFYNKKAIKGRLDALLGLIEGDIEGKSVLEVGCGPGFYSIKLAQRGARVTALDYAKGMIDAARANAEKAGVKIDFVVSDFMDISFKEKFDYVFATGVMDYVKKGEHRIFLDKMAQASNGFVIVSFPKKYVIHALVRKLWLNLFKKVYVTFFTDDHILELASACGLKEIKRIDVGILWVVKFEKVL